MTVRYQAVLCATLAAVGLSLAMVQTQTARTLDIYFIDVEGGQSTLFVSPTGETMLVDAGSRGDRDADRIADVAKQAGASRIDVMLTTHFDADHHGGVKEVAARLPIRTFVDHGPRIVDAEAPSSPQAVQSMERSDSAYKEAVATGRHLVLKPGDTVPFPSVDVRIVAGAREAIKQPLAGAGAPNPLCSSYEPHDVDHSENSYSLGFVLQYQRFRMLDLGDLTWNREHDLVCPNNLLGTVDVYLTTHHGLNLSGPKVLVHAIRPRVAIMNNGPRKGAAAETMATVRSAPGLEDLWQLHYSVPRPPNTGYYEMTQPGGPELNTAENFIANLAEEAAHTPAHSIKVSARPDGSFVVTNSRTGFSKEYRR